MLVAKFREDLICLLRGTAESLHQNLLSMRTVVPGLAALGYPEDNLSPRFLHSNERGSASGTGEHLHRCCERVNDFLKWLGSRTPGAFPMMSTPYGTLRHLLTVEYMFVDGLWRTSTAQSIVLPKILPGWIAKLET